MHKILRSVRDKTLEHFYLIAGLGLGQNIFYDKYLQTLIDYINSKEDSAFKINDNISKSLNWNYLRELDE